MNYKQFFTLEVDMYGAKVISRDELLEYIFNRLNSIEETLDDIRVTTDDCFNMLEDISTD